MANPVRGEAAVKIGGKDYTLVFTANALCEVEYILEMSTDRILAVLAVSPPLHVIRALLWGGLRKHHEDIDLISAGELMEALGGGAATLEAVGRGLSAAFPDVPEGTDQDRPRKGASAGTGRRSSKAGSQ